MAKEQKLKASIDVKGSEVRIISNGKEDYICITDIAKYKADDANDVIKNWMRNKDTIEFLGLWEELNNPTFKPVEFEGFKTNAGSNSFVLAPQKWIEKTNAKGIISNSGRKKGEEK